MRPSEAEQAGPALGGRLHPAAVAVWSAGQIGALALLLLLNPRFAPAALPLLAVVVGTSAVRYARFRWQLTPATLVIEQGLLQRRRRVIPRERVQSVDLVRGVSHRLLRVVAVHVEAIGASDTEGRLDALAPEVAERVRAALLAGRPAPPPPAGDRSSVPPPPPARGAPAPPAPAPTAAPARPTGEMLVRLGPRRLLLSGATEANATLLAAIGGLVWQLAGDRVAELAERVPALVGSGQATVALAAVVVLALLLLVAAHLVLYWNFTLVRAGDALQVRRGLLEQRFDTVPLQRVQAVRLEENLPRRLLGYAAVRADVAGKPGGGAGGTDMLMPVGTVAEARTLVAEVLGVPAARDVVLEPMPRRARTRRLVRALAAVLAASAVTTALWGPLGLAALLLAVPALAVADGAYRALGHARLPGLVVARAGWWVRRTAFVPESRLQTLALSATPPQRWRRLATLELHIARSPGLWSGPRMIDLDGDAGRDLVRALAPVIADRGS